MTTTHEPISNGAHADESGTGQPLASLAHTRILVVDDDPAFRRLCTLALQEAGVAHVAVGSAMEAMSAIKDAGQQPFDLILLDLELPGMKGGEFLEHLRNNGRDTPVVLVTVLDDVKSKVSGLDRGAEDYIVKPCSFDELFSRLEAVLRRFRSRRCQQVGNLEIDPMLGRVRRNGRLIDLTRREYELLAFLVQESGKVLTKSELLSRVCQVESEPSTNFLQVHFSRLRRKLEPLEGLRIETIYGVGYRLVPDATRTSAPGSPTAK